MKIRIFGDSHVGTLKHGWTDVKSYALKNRMASDFYSRHGVNWIKFSINDSGAGIHLFADRVPGRGPVDYLLDDSADMYVFSAPLHSGPVYRDPTWRSFCPWQCANQHFDMQPVSDGVLETWTDRQLACQIDMLGCAIKRGYRIAVVEAPKPLSRTPDLHKIHPDILLTVDRLYRESVVRRLAELGVTIIPVPDRLQANGFTPPEFSSENPADPHHGSTSFGATMLRAIFDVALSKKE